MVFGFSVEERLMNIIIKINNKIRKEEKLEKINMVGLLHLIKKLKEKIDEIEDREKLEKEAEKLRVIFGLTSKWKKVSMFRSVAVQTGNLLEISKEKSPAKTNITQGLTNLINALTALIEDIKEKEVIASGKLKPSFS